jgi:F-type H+-transporting ATPase subunit gamma
MSGNRQFLGRRIRGVRETGKVTRAMEMVASARMRRTELRAIEARPYERRLSDLFGQVVYQSAVLQEHPFLIRKEEEPVLVLHFTPDKGLCGGLNTRLNHSLAGFLSSRQSGSRVIAVGRKGREFVLRSRMDLLAEFSGMGDAPGIADLRPLCVLATDMFERGESNRVYLSYPRFQSVMVQRPVIERLLPAEPPATEGRRLRDFVYEPDVNRVLDALITRYVEAAVYHAYVECVASEYSARMVAMHNATDSARELVEDMTMELNKARQTAITAEICDVAAGTDALTGGWRG